MLEAVHAPRTLSDAIASLNHPRSVAIAGGTLLMPRVNAGAEDIARLVSLRRLPLGAIQVDGGMATIGATVTLGALAERADLRFLWPALDQVASPTIRNMATVGGNLFAPSPYGDLAVCFIALGADAIVSDGILERRVPVETIVVSGVGAGEVVTAVTFAMPAGGSFRFRKAARRALNSAALVTVAAVVEVADGAVSACRIALGAVAPTPIRARSVEAELTGMAFDAPTVSAAVDALAADIAPASDAYASAWYRARVAPVHLRRALLGQ